MPKLMIVWRLLTAMAVTLSALGAAKADPEGSPEIVTVEVEREVEAGTLQPAPCPIDASAAQLGDEPIAVTAREAALSVPDIRKPLPGGAGPISGGVTAEEAQGFTAPLSPPPVSVAGLRVAETCAAAQPRAPPGGAMIWSRPAVIACN